MTKRRRFHRFPFDAKAVLHVGTHSSVPCELLDLSLNGALVRLPEPLPDKPRDIDRLGLAVRGEVRGDTVTMSMEVEAVHRDERQLGVRFTQVDVDSFAALKTLIEDNLGDPGLLDRELTQLDYWPGSQPEEEVG